MAGRFNRGEIRFRAPSDLCLSRNYEEVVQLVTKIWAVLHQAKMFVDFKSINTVSPDAALLLAATFDMWQRVKNSALRTRDIERWVPEVSHVFRSLGLFDLLRTPGLPPINQERVTNVEILKLQSGLGADGSLARELTQALGKIFGQIDEEPLYVGLTEAMTNSGQHAYPEEFYKEIPPEFRRWWMTGSYDKSLNSLRILILDLGVGIPFTLPRSSIGERIAGYLARYTTPDDADRIDAAVQVGRTSTGTQGRGNGLDEIRKFIEQSPGGRLRILSGKGEVVYTSGDVHPKKSTHVASVPGTLIEWEIFR